jgi:hypothetical protein
MNHSWRHILPLSQRDPLPAAAALHDIVLALAHGVDLGPPSSEKGRVVIDAVSLKALSADMLRPAWRGEERI